MGNENLGVIVVTDWNDHYTVYLGTDLKYIETGFSKEEETSMFAYVAGLKNGSDIPHTNILNGPPPFDFDQWFYAGDPLNDELFQKLLDYVHPPRDEDYVHP